MHLLSSDFISLCPFYGPSLSAADGAHKIWRLKAAFRVDRVPITYPVNQIKHAFHSTIQLKRPIFNKLFSKFDFKSQIELFHNDCFTFKWLNFCFVLWPFLRNSLIVYNHVLSLELHIIGGAEEQ